jgi:meiotically up-regulated gene 157 (Mug157) protein
MSSSAAPSSGRPAFAERRFTSIAVEAALARIGPAVADPRLRRLFENCLPNTLDTTVTFSRDALGRPDTFVITGDIAAMWLRDSTHQVWPYLRFARDDAPLRELLVGVVRRQAACVRLDPYANAFYATPVTGDWAEDLTLMRPGVHERKYELDSLCAVFRLAHGYWQATGDTSPFDADWHAAMQLAVESIVVQQAGSAEEPEPAYTFRRLTPQALDTLPLNGRGHPARRCGLSKSPFRPSDDAASLPFPIAANAFAVVALRNLAALLDALSPPCGPALSSRARAVAAEIHAGLLDHGTVHHPTCGRIWAFEVDGYGSSVLLDDANIPSLLSLPYLGFCAADDPLYLATRRFVLSEANPYFARGAAASGVGGPHVGLGWIWPMSIIMRALTSTDDEEILDCLDMLVRTDAGTGFMHETFWLDDPSRFTRPWFAWANTLLGELVLHLASTRPALLTRPLP